MAKMILKVTGPQNQFAKVGDMDQGKASGRFKVTLCLWKTTPAPWCHHPGRIVVAQVASLSLNDATSCCN